MFPEWLQLQTSNLVCTSTKQSTIYNRKARSRGYIFNLRIAVTSYETAKATDFLFSVLTDCQE